MSTSRVRGCGSEFCKQNPDDTHARTGHYTTTALKYIRKARDVCRCVYRYNTDDYEPSSSSRAWWYYRKLLARGRRNEGAYYGENRCGDDCGGFDYDADDNDEDDYDNGDYGKIETDSLFSVRRRARHWFWVIRLPVTFRLTIRDLQWILF